MLTENEMEELNHNPEWASKTWAARKTYVTGSYRTKYGFEVRTEAWLKDVLHELGEDVLTYFSLDFNTTHPNAEWTDFSITLTPRRLCKKY